MRMYSSGPCLNRGRDPPYVFCGGCYTNLRGKTSYRDHRRCFLSHSFANILERVTMKRDDNVSTRKKGEWSCPDSAFLKSYPLLAAGLCDIWWEDGKPREPWTMTVRFEEDAVHLCLNDKSKGQGAYTTGESLQDVFRLVEAALGAQTLSWRRWKK